MIFSRLTESGALLKREIKMIQILKLFIKSTYVNTFKRPSVFFLTQMFWMGRVLTSPIGLKSFHSVCPVAESGAHHAGGHQGGSAGLGQSQCVL